MDENQALPANTGPGKEPGNIVPAVSPPQAGNSITTDLPASSPDQTKKEMEVHHHGHVHEKKKWKEYVFQFIMLFLAVFLGALAENYREHTEEDNREKQYTRSLMVDSDNDLILSSGLNTSITEQIQKIDTLQTLFSSELENNLTAVRKCYALSEYIQKFYAQFFNERTITQLLSSGNMRLIKRQGVADSIMEYHSFIKFVEVQKQLYINSVSTCMQSMYNVYDISFLRTALNDDGLLDYITVDPGKLKFRTTDPVELKKFNATLEITKLVANNYNNLLSIMASKAKRLYGFLKEEYHIK